MQARLPQRRAAEGLAGLCEDLVARVRCMEAKIIWTRVQTTPGEMLQVPVNGKDSAEAVRSFETGASRSADNGRYDPEAFLSPQVLEGFCEYMQRNRQLADGSLRDGDNWQKGIPLPVYAKGLNRHHLHFWARHRGAPIADENATGSVKDDLHAILFNAMGYLFELYREENNLKANVPVKLESKA